MSERFGAYAVVMASPVRVEDSRDALAIFVDAHVGTPWRDDIGPLIGQASILRQHGLPDEETLRLWNAAVRAAVSGDAPRDRTSS